MKLTTNDLATYLCFILYLLCSQSEVYFIYFKLISTYVLLHYSVSLYKLCAYGLPEVSHLSNAHSPVRTLVIFCHHLLFLQMFHKDLYVYNVI